MYVSLAYLVWKAGAAGGLSEIESCWKKHSAVSNSAFQRRIENHTRRVFTAQVWLITKASSYAKMIGGSRPIRDDSVLWSLYLKDHESCYSRRAGCFQPSSGIGVAAQS